MTEGAAFAVGPCWSCGAVFAFDPDLVPSVPIDPVTHLPPDLGGDVARATRQPFCRRCLAEANVRRRSSGLPLWEVLPGAYADDEG